MSETKPIVLGYWDEKRVNDVMNSFPFNEAHSIMSYTEHYWSGGDIPNVDEIREHCRDMLIMAASEKTTLSSGGYEASYHVFDGNAHLSLSYVPVEVESESTYIPAPAIED